MRQVELPGGERVPALGQGTWMMGENAARRDDELAALRTGIDRGLTLIDTAEMYGEGAAEELVGEAVAGRREEVFLVSKAYPQNASMSRLPLACRASLRRLGTDRIDLYLLHWRGQVPLGETVEAMETLLREGLIRHWGVSNLDTADMEDLVAHGGRRCATDQILYNLTRRGPEWELLPWLEGHRIPAMAYSPVEQGRLLRRADLATVAGALDLSPAQLALAWTLARPGMIVIPKAANPAHTADNAAAAEVTLDEETLLTLDRLFPPPTRGRPLEMI